MNDDRKRITEAMLQHRQLAKQRDEIEIQLSHLESFIRATARILPDGDRLKMQKVIALMFTQTLGLTDAVRMALRSHRGKWMSAPIIRGYLEDIGFDFIGYTSNPLTSIHTVAKRMIPHDVEVHHFDDQVSYRWKGK